jgi:hypothetical protein
VKERKKERKKEKKITFSSSFDTMKKIILEMSFCLGYNGTIRNTLQNMIPFIFFLHICLFVYLVAIFEKKKTFNFISQQEVIRRNLY